MNKRPGKSLVLGAAGFLGSNLVTRLLESESEEVIAFGRNFSGLYSHERLEQISGDFSNPECYQSDLPNVSTVYHLLSSTNVSSSRENPTRDIEENLIATIKLLELCKAAGVKKIVYLSSGGAIYGNPSRLPIEENDPTWPLTSYGITKLAIERHLYRSSIEFGIRTVSLRVSNPFGPHQRVGKNQGAIAHLMNSAVSGSEFEIWGDGEIIRDYVFVEDVIDAILLASKYDGPERVFNIGSGIGTSLNELVAQVEEVTNASLKIQKSPSRSFDVLNNVLDISLAKNELNWAPKTNLISGLKKTYQWWEAIN